MGPTFIYETKTTRSELKQYLANSGILQLLRRKNPDELPDNEEEDPRAFDKLLTVMIEQANGLGWNLPLDWYPYAKPPKRPNTPVILKTLTMHELRQLVQNQAELLRNIVDENSLYATCESKRAHEPTIKIPMRIRQESDTGKLFWGVPFLWKPGSRRRRGRPIKEHFTYDINLRKVELKTDDKGKPICDRRSIPWDPVIQLRTFATTSHGWPIPFVPKKQWENKTNENLLEKAEEQLKKVKDLDIISKIEMRIKFIKSLNEQGIEWLEAFTGENGIFPAGTIQFSYPEPIRQGVIAPVANLIPEDIDETTQISPEILPHSLPDGSPPPEELPLTLEPPEEALKEPFEWQKHAVDRWVKAEGYGPRGEAWAGGMIEACTGAGKTHMCFMAIDAVLGNPEYANTRISIVVPTIVLMKQWYKQAKKAFGSRVDRISRHGGGYKEAAGQISIWVIDTASDYLDRAEIQHPHLEKYTYHFLIVDEVHRSAAATFRYIYDSNADFRLGVTATLPGRGEKLADKPEDNPPGIKKFFILKDRLGEVLCEYKYPHALKKGNISPFKLTYLETNFTTEEGEAYKALTAKLAQQQGRVEQEKKSGNFYPAGYTKEDYDQLTPAQKEDLGDPRSLQTLKYLGSARARIDWGAANRMTCAIDLIREKLAQGKKIIVFHKSIDHVNALFNALTMGYSYGAQDAEGNIIPGKPETEIGLYHSDEKTLSTVAKNNFLEAFRREDNEPGPKVKCLLSVESLLEGLDVPSADVGIVVAATKSQIKAVQALGRVLRVKRDEDGKPVEEYKEYYFITIGDSIGDGQVKAKFESCLVDKDSNFIIPVDEKTGRPPVHECPFHEREETDYVHDQAGLMHYAQIKELATQLRVNVAMKKGKPVQLVTRTELIKAIDEEEKRQQLKRAEEGRIELTEEEKKMKWYRKPIPILPQWALEKTKKKSKKKRRRNPDRDIQELKRACLIDPTDEVALQKYLHALMRTRPELASHDFDCDVIRYLLAYESDAAHFEQLVQRYLSEWPNYCEDCGGWGGHYSTYDPSPSGVGLSPGFMTDYDPCETCVENDICPRCGENTISLIDGKSEDWYECKSCRWDDRQGFEGMPQDPPMPPECNCWERHLPRRY
jgi:superfamily II DNA or RNA helicase